MLLAPVGTKRARVPLLQAAQTNNALNSNVITPHYAAFVNVALVCHRGQLVVGSPNPHFAMLVLCFHASRLVFSLFFFRYKLATLAEGDSNMPSEELKRDILRARTIHSPCVIELTKRGSLTQRITLCLSGVRCWPSCPMGGREYAAGVTPNRFRDF